MMLETRHDNRRREARSAGRESLIARWSLLVASLCGFIAIFGAAHLLLIHIAKPSGYVFFSTLLVVPLLVMALLSRMAADPRAGWQSFGLGALMCLCAIPVIYLARFAPESARQTVRNLLGLPFLALALIGPFVFYRPTRNTGA